LKVISDFSKLKTLVAAEERLIQKSKKKILVYIIQCKEMDLMNCVDFV